MGDRHGKDRRAALVTDQIGLVPTLDSDQATAAILVEVHMSHDGKIFGGYYPHGRIFNRESPRDYGDGLSSGPTPIDRRVCTTKVR